MSELIGRNLGSYRIVEQLGLGGMATVYKAYQPSMDRYVAIKVLPRHFAHDPTFIGRFEQEAKVIAKLENARILPVYDYGEDDDITYIVMRYLETGTLTERLAGGPIGMGELAHIVSQIAEGLDYAHARGVIHRDVKPSNIMIDQSGDVYITDFGISKLVEGTAQFTGSGIVGTPAYVSPEQGRGDVVDYRSDIYSLGVVLYQMATSDVPFHAETPMAVVIKHIYEPLPLPRSVNPDLPESVELVILKAMAKDPDERYQSCGEMAEALRAAVQGIPPEKAVTEVSTPTVELVAPPAPPTPPVPMPAPEDTIGMATEPGTGEQPGTRRRGWVLPVVIVSALVVLVAIVAAALLLTGVIDLGGREVDGGEEPAEPSPGVEEPPPGEEPVEGAPVPRELGCAPGQQPVVFADFEGREIPFDVPEGMELLPLDGGRQALALIPAPDGGARLDFGPEMSSSTVFVQVIFPEGPATLVLFSRTSPSGAYAGLYEGDHVALLRGGRAVAERGEIPPLSDGQPHILALHTEGLRVEFHVDDKPVMEWEDPEPLPPGGFALEVNGSLVLLDTLLVCGYEGEAVEGGMPGEPGAPGEPEREMLFQDDFDGTALRDGWVWLNEPPGSWALDAGRLMVEVLPETGIRLDDPDALEVIAPALAVEVPSGVAFGARVDLEMAPFQNYQQAGLVVFSRTRQPLFKLMRLFCDQPEGCQGDAIYFDDLRQLARNADGYHGYVVGGGELPPEGRISLRIVVAEHRIMGFYSLDGWEWQLVGEWPLLAELRVGYVGLMTGSGRQPVPVIPAFFDNFIVLLGEEP